MTRERLLSAARELFRKEGYATTSVERIAEAAGYSKGAVYSNFDSKEAIFLTVLEAEGEASLTELLAEIGQAANAQAILELLVRWADERSRSGSWSLTILEHARLAGPGSASLRQQEKIIRHQWRRLGDTLLARFPGLEEEGELLGALLHELAYAPAMTFVSQPTAGSLMRLVVSRLFAGVETKRGLKPKESKDPSEEK